MTKSEIFSIFFAEVRKWEKELIGSNRLSIFMEDDDIVVAYSAGGRSLAWLCNYKHGLNYLLRTFKSVYNVFLDLFKKKSIPSGKGFYVEIKQKENDTALLTMLAPYIPGKVLPKSKYSVCYEDILIPNIHNAIEPLIVAIRGIRLAVYTVVPAAVNKMLGRTGETLYSYKITANASETCIAVYPNGFKNPCTDLIFEKDNKIVARTLATHSLNCFDTVTVSGKTYYIINTDARYSYIKVVYPHLAYFVTDENYNLADEELSNKIFFIKSMRDKINA